MLRSALGLQRCTLSLPPCNNAAAAASRPLSLLPHPPAPSPPLTHTQALHLFQEVLDQGLTWGPDITYAMVRASLDMRAAGVEDALAVAHALMDTFERQGAGRGGGGPSVAGRWGGAGGGAGEAGGERGGGQGRGARGKGWMLHTQRPGGRGLGML